MKKLGMFLLTLTLASLSCAKSIITKEAEVRSGPGLEGKQGGTLKAGDELGQADISAGEHNVQVSDGKLGSISKFEKVPADEERLIEDMAVLLQEDPGRMPVCNGAKKNPPLSKWPRFAFLSRLSVPKSVRNWPTIYHSPRHIPSLNTGR